MNLSAAERERLLAAAVAGRATAPKAPDPAFSAPLPARLTSLVGREREVAEVQDLVLVRRLVTLTGAGGVGKTTLALAVATEVQGRFTDGMTLVEFATLAEDQPVPQAVATVLGVHERPGEPTLAALCRVLRHDPVCSWSWTTASTCCSAPPNSPRRCSGRVQTCTCW